MSNKVKYGVWKRRIVPILKASGWNIVNIDGILSMVKNSTESRGFQLDNVRGIVVPKGRFGLITYMVNERIGQRFEYRYYGNSAPVWIGDLEAVA